VFPVPSTFKPFKFTAFKNRILDLYTLILITKTAQWKKDWRDWNVAYSNTFASKMKNVCWGIKQKSDTEKKLLVLNKIIETQLFHS